MKNRLNEKRKIDYSNRPRSQKEHPGDLVAIKLLFSSFKRLNEKSIKRKTQNRLLDYLIKRKETLLTIKDLL